MSERPILVVGANGFLGSHLVDSLAARGAPVRAFDRFSTEPRFAPGNAVEVVRGDFANHADIRAAVAGCRSVFHFLSTSTPASSKDDPTFDLRTNVTPTVELLAACVDSGVDTFYFASSGGTLYGPSLHGRSNEDDALAPISPYGIGKATLESYLRYFRISSGLRSVAFRIANPYGPRQDARQGQGLIPIALRGVRDTGSVVMYGDGGMVRDYLHVDDLMTMIVNVFEGEPRHGVYNLGSGQGVSVKEIFEILADVTGVPFAIEAREQPSTFLERSVLDVSRYTAEWGPPPDRPLRDGIRALWESIRSERP